MINRSTHRSRVQPSPEPVANITTQETRQSAGPSVGQIQPPGVQHTEGRGFPCDYEILQESPPRGMA